MESAGEEALEVLEVQRVLADAVRRAAVGPVAAAVKKTFARFQSSALCEGTSEIATATGCEAPNSARVSISLPSRFAR